MEKISFKKAFFIILSSLFCCVAIASLFLAYGYFIKKKQKQDPFFNIVAIAQSTKEIQALKTAYLAELLNLSQDKPTNLYSFNSEEGKAKLLKSSLIKDAHIKKIKPGVIFVDYILRKPMAFLGDFSNTAIDEEGFLIPFKPFFTPKKLPEIVIGLSIWGETSKTDEEEFAKWGVPLQGPRASLALKIFKYIQNHHCSEDVALKRLDVSKAFALSYGRRQIVVILEEKISKEKALILSTRILRLSTKNYSKELANYESLRDYLKKRAFNQEGIKGVVHGTTFIIDLRAPQLAYVSEEA